MGHAQARNESPGFALHDTNGDAVNLHDFAEEKVILYFYLKDNTPGCIRQVCAFAVAYVEFEKLNAVSSASART